MKILLVITKAEIGGAQAFVLTLAKGLKARGQEVAVAAGAGDYLSNALQEAGIRFIRLKSLKRSGNPFSTLTSAYELRQLIRREGFSVLHLNSSNALSGALAAKMSGRKIKTIFTVHGLSVLDENYQTAAPIKASFKKYFRFFLRFVDEVVCVSEHNLAAVRRSGLTNKGGVIYNGLNLPPTYFWNRSRAREELQRLCKSKLKDDDFLIGSIGRLAYQKNYEFLIRSWKQIKALKPQAKLLIIGAGPEEEKYQRLIKEGGLTDEIYLPGLRAEASELLQGFDLFVLPSIYEGLSISLIETIFSGVPALASDVGGNREVIGADNCYPLDDEEEFLKKLMQAPAYPAAASITKFSAQEMVEKYLRVYEI